MRWVQGFPYRALLISVAFLACGISPALPLEPSPCGAREHECSKEPDEANLTRHCCYVNSYGHEVHAPSPLKPGAPPPQRSSALCRDGYYSFSEHRSGTCSGHRGVKSWLGLR